MAGGARRSEAPRVFLPMVRDPTMVRLRVRPLPAVQVFRKPDSVERSVIDHTDPERQTAIKLFGLGDHVGKGKPAAGDGHLPTATHRYRTRRACHYKMTCRANRDVLVRGLLTDELQAPRRTCSTRCPRRARWTGHARGTRRARGACRAREASRTDGTGRTINAWNALETWRSRQTGGARQACGAGLTHHASRARRADGTLSADRTGEASESLRTPDVPRQGPLLRGAALTCLIVDHPKRTRRDGPATGDLPSTGRGNGRSRDAPSKDHRGSYPHRQPTCEAPTLTRLDTNAHNIPPVPTRPLLGRRRRFSRRSSRAQYHEWAQRPERPTCCGYRHLSAVSGGSQRASSQ